MKKSYSMAVSLGLIIGFLILVNLAGAMIFRHSRVDLTSEKLYTLSDGTQNIIDKLGDNLHFKLYANEKVLDGLPGMKLYVTRVKEMLEEYVNASKGKISLTLLDPKPDTEEEELAEKYGLQRVPLQGNEWLYFGMVISDESGNDEVIKFFNPDEEEFLEYNISKAVVNISNPKKKVVGVISPLPVMGQKTPGNMQSLFSGNLDERSPWALIVQLKQLYTLREIPLDTASIDDDVDILLLIHPKGLSPETRLAVDQYLLKGGRIVAFVDPDCEADSPPPNPGNPYESMFYDKSSNIPELLASWGLDMKSDKLAADIDLAANVQTASYRIVPYPIYLNLGEKNINGEEVITGGVEDLLFASAGSLTATKINGDLEIVPLVRTTEGANLVEKKPFMEPEKLLNEFTRGKSSLSLAYRVSGKFKTAFPEGVKSEDKTLTPKLKESMESSSVVVFGDVDFITDRFSAKKSNFFGQTIIKLMNGNINLAYNTVEVLAGSQDLISIRSRGGYERPFTKVSEMQRSAQEKWRTKEAELQAKVTELEEKLSALQSRRTDEYSGQVLTAEQMTEIEKFKSERLDYQRQLREVRKNLREDVERLHRNLKIINTWTMPVVIILFSLALYNVRRKRRERL